MTRKLLVAFLAFLLTVHSASAQLFDDSEWHFEPTGCGIVGYECGMVAFVNVATGSYMIVARMEAPTVAEMRYWMSDMGIQETFDAMGMDTFMGYKEVTHKANLKVPSSSSNKRSGSTRSRARIREDVPRVEYRVFEGKTEGIDYGTYDPATAFVINMDDEAMYFVFSVNPMHSTINYVEWVIAGNDYTLPPLGYEFLPLY